MEHSNKNYAININSNNDINYVMIGSQISEINHDDIKDQINSSKIYKRLEG